MEKIIKGTSLSFYKTIAEDIEEILDIEYMEENRAFIFSWTRERHIEAINSLDELHITIRRNKDKKIIGYILLSGLLGEDKSLELRRIAISEKGNGYGRESIGLIKKMAFNILSFHRLWLDVYDDNLRAISLYKSEGFVEEGLLRECKKSEKGYRSMLIMSILQNEYI